MKRFIISFVLLFAMGAIYAQSGTITVTVVSVPVTGLTSIDYEFTGIATRTYDLTVEVKFDAADYVAIPEAHLSDNISNVSGTGTAFSGTIVWDGAASFPDRFHEQTRIKIMATLSDFQCGDNITFTYRGSEVTYGTIEKGGLCWMDRNLGASGVATGSADAASYGDLFQWGRLSDGHQDRASTVTSTLSTTDVPGHGKFITNGASPWDWLETQDEDAKLWQGGADDNNPCPPGWRVPTEAEWNAERLSWAPNHNAAGAFASPLKLPVAGFRIDINGSLSDVGSRGRYWSSTVDGVYSQYLLFTSSSASMDFYYRAFGLSVRCLKD